MTTVELSCGSEPVPAGAEGGDQAHRPVIAVDGQAVWRGRPEPTPEDAERVALAYLRYALGGLLAGPPDQIGPGGPPDEPGAKDPADLAAEALETLGREVAGALRRFGDLLESGDWRRFLGG